jgi:hypothetical protein
MRRFLGQLNLGQPAYPRPKGTGDQSMPEKRRQARSASRTLRKTRVTRSRLDCFKSNPDRDSTGPLTRGWNPQADSVRSSCAGLRRRRARQVRTMRYQEIDPGRKDEWTTSTTLGRTTSEKCGIAYRARASWRRSPRSSPGPRKSDTRRRGVGGPE